MSLTCPKCHNVMRQYERNDVVVDQCTECKGLFLDRGELEKLVAAETSWYGGGPQADPRYEPRYEPRREPRYEQRYERHHDDDDDDDHRYRKKDRRRSFLENLFD
jgi:Zn-finger nucleic acid-binding protein